jgi:hypothetical protein
LSRGEIVEYRRQERFTEQRVGGDPQRAAGQRALVAESAVRVISDADQLGVA